MSIPFYFDIETIPDQSPDAQAKCLMDLKPPASMKLQKTIETWWAEKAPAAALEAYHKTGLHGISGEICSVAWALDSGEPKSLLRRSGESEAVLLQSFFDMVHDQAVSLSQDGPGMPGHYQLHWIMHNSDFDLRYLWQRCVIMQVQPKFTIPVNAKPGGDHVSCTMRSWAGMYGQKFISQDKLAQALGLKGKDDIDGSMVWELYQMGEYQQIQDYNEDDVRTVREIHKRLTFS